MARVVMVWGITWLATHSIPAEGYEKKTRLLPFVYTDAIRTLSGDNIAIRKELLNDVYSSVQYKIECGAFKNQNVPKIPDATISEKLAYSKCHDFVNVKNNAVTFVFNGVSHVRRLYPVPYYQKLSNEYKTIELTDNRPGMSLGRISSCCDAASCPSSCLEAPMDDCALELYGPGFKFGSMGDGLEQKTVPIPTLDFIARIPCKRCSVESCLTNCSNGEVMIKNTILYLPCTNKVLLSHSMQQTTLISAWKATPCRPKNLNVSPVLQEPGTHA